MENDRGEVPSNLSKSATTVDQNPTVSGPPAIDVKNIRSKTEDGNVFSKDVRATFSKIRKEKLLKKEKQMEIRKEKLLKKEKQMEIEKSKMETCDTGAKKRKREEVNTDISKVRFVYHNVRKREIIRSTNKRPTLGEVLNPNYLQKKSGGTANNKRKKSEKQELKKQSEIKETEVKEDMEIVNGTKIKGTNEIKETEIKGDIEIVNGTKIKGTNEIEETEIKKPGKHAPKSRSRRRLRIRELVKKGQRENKEAEMKEHMEIVNETKIIDTNESKETGIKEDIEIEIVNGTKVKGSNEIQDTEIKKPGENAATNKRKRLKKESQSENKETEIKEDIEIVSGTKIMGTNEINETEIKKPGKNAAHSKRKKLKKQELKKQKEIKETEIQEDIKIVNERKIIDSNEIKETEMKEHKEIVNETKINDSNEIKETGIKEDIEIANGTKVKRKKLKKQEIKKQNENKETEIKEHKEVVNLIKIDDSNEIKETGIKEEKGIVIGTKINETINHVEKSKKKLLVFDINGLLVDIVSPRPKYIEADYYIPKRAVFKRPFLDGFLRFCFERFNVAIWSSRTKKVLDPVVNFALGDFKKKLLFIWDASRCTGSGARTREDKHKPIVFKKLRKFWESDARYNLWRKGAFDESNTLLVDDSPYKALLNPKNTGIFPLSYSYENENDDFLGPNGALRTYLEGLAASDDVRTYVDQHPFGQTPIDEKHPQWHFYSRLLKNQKL